MNILVADDEAIIRTLITSALTKTGHNVVEAGNGREAWDRWQAEKFRLVVSDWMMPDLSGPDFCRQIRDEASASYTYVILLTSLAGKVNYLAAMDAGADDFITKPFEKDAFVARVRVAERILGLHSSLEEANRDLEKRVLARTEELQNTVRCMEEILGRTSQELYTPIHHLLGCAQLLSIGELNKEQQERAQQIVVNGRHLLELVEGRHARKFSNPAPATV
jgi:DNA-binding response OmpR family regulator